MLLLSCLLHIRTDGVKPIYPANNLVRGSIITQDHIDYKSALVLVMTWCHQEPSHYPRKAEKDPWQHISSLRHNKLTLSRGLNKMVAIWFQDGTFNAFQDVLCSHFVQASMMWLRCWTTWPATWFGRGNIPWTVPSHMQETSIMDIAAPPTRILYQYNIV